MQDLLGFLPEQGVRLGLAVVLGGVIGLEREASDKPAGLRTIGFLGAGTILHSRGGVTGLTTAVLQCTVTRGQMTGLLARLCAAPGIRSVKQL